MPDGLLVILGAEATLLVFVAAMTLYARRMDVLSGRSFERSVASPTGNRHPSRSIRRKLRNLLRLIRRWGDLTTFAPSNLLRRPDITRTPRSGLETRPQTPSRLVTRFRQPGTPAADASGRPAVLSGLVATPAPVDKGASPECVQSSAAIFREDSALLEGALRLVVQRLEQIGQRGPTSRLDEDLHRHSGQQLG
jgi:hypothetical protein